MGILNKEELLKLADDKKLFYNDDFVRKNFKSASYDLRIGTIYKEEKIFSNDHDNSLHFVKIKPSEIVTMLTLEVITIPPDCTGTVFAINRMSSRGLLILNPGHIDPGYIGPISVCAINLSNDTIKLDLNDSIFTLILSELKSKIKTDQLYSPSYPSTTRKEYESSYYKKSFSLLSNSIFDLVVNHQESRKLLIEKLIQNFLAFCKKSVSAIVILLTIGAAFYTIFPESSIFNGKEKEIQEIESKAELLKDTISNLKNKVAELEEVITKEEKLKKNGKN